MSRWLVADSLYCPGAFPFSHLDSYSHYLREYGEDGDYIELRAPSQPGSIRRAYGVPDVLFALDRYGEVAAWDATKRIAQVAAICNPMPWDVRKSDGSPAYDLIVSSIPWMVDEARAKGCRAEYQALAFDVRARACGMGVAERDIKCLFVGTTGANHLRRTALLEELKDVVTVAPPTFGRDYFRLLARARSVLNIHAEWSRGAANAMRMFEATGMGAMLFSDGGGPFDVADIGFGVNNAADVRQRITQNVEQWDEGGALAEDFGLLMREHTYENRIPRLVELARSL